METWTTVIEHEGWLFKRGAGYNVEEAQADLVEKFRNGKGEKKRYMMLTRTRGDGIIAEKAELLWYTQDPQRKKKAVPKGSLSLATTHKVKVIDGVLIELHTPERTFYFRPVADPASAESRTTVAQWQAAINYTITRIKDSTPDSSSVVESNSKSPFTRIRRMIRSPSSSSVVQSIEEVDTTPILATPKNITDAKGYYSLWMVSGIDGYNALMAHFGPFQTDLQRLKSHVEVRISQLSEQCNILEKNRIQVSEPIIIVQKTTREALQLVYNENRERLDVFAPVIVKLTNEVLRPIEQLIAGIKEELENVVRHFGKYTQKLERSKKAVIQSAKEVKEKEERYKHLQELAKDFESSGKLLTDKAIQSTLKKNIMPPKRGTNIGSAITSGVKRGAKPFLDRKISFKMNPRGTRATSQHKKDDMEAAANINEYANEVATARQNRREMEIEYEGTQKKISKNMKAAMEKLEKLERDALTQLKVALEKLAFHEGELYSQMAKKLASGSAVDQRVTRINPEEDMKSTTEFLLKEAKKRLKAEA